MSEEQHEAIDAFVHHILSIGELSGSDAQFLEKEYYDYIEENKHQVTK